MKHPQPSKISSGINKAQYSTPHLTCKDKIQLSKQSKHKKSFISGIPPSPIHPCTFSICFGLTGKTQTSLLSKLSGTLTPWFHQALGIMSSLNHPNVPHGDTMQPKHCILTLSFTTTRAMMSVLKTPESMGHQMPSNSTTTPSPYPHYQMLTKYSRSPSTSKML